MSKRHASRNRVPFELEVDWFSPDIESLEDWIPERAEDVFYCLELAIRPVRGCEEHFFQALIATPQGLQAHKERYGRLRKDSQRILFVFTDYSWADVEREIRTTVEQCTAGNLDDSLLNLRKRFQWEYEDYRG